MGYVTGKVTLDGKPLAGVMVVFNPEKGRAATAIADKEGHYDLMYTRQDRGTKVGPSTVRFTWQTGDSGPSIPEKYDSKSELKCEVKHGKNVFDFALESDKSQSPTQKVAAPAIID